MFKTFLLPHTFRGTLQNCKENVLKVVAVFLYTYPEHDGDVSTNTVEDVAI